LHDSPLITFDYEEHEGQFPAPYVAKCKSEEGICFVGKSRKSAALPALQF
jgi:hypothetical protein